MENLTKKQREENLASVLAEWDESGLESALQYDHPKNLPKDVGTIMAKMIVLHEQLEKLIAEKYSHLQPNG